MKRRVACVVADGFEDSELKEPVAHLVKAGFEVDFIASEAHKELTGKAGKVRVISTTAIADANPSRYLGLLIPGGQSPSKLRREPAFVSLVTQFVRSKKPIAAICHGPQLLIAAGAVKGRTMTAYKDVQKELAKAGATVKDEAVVSDGTWLTSRTPDDLPEFCSAVVEQFTTNADQSWMSRGDVHPKG